jgi:hypothetical protein
MMGLAAVAASGLLALNLGALGGPGSLVRLEPATLEPASHALRLPNATLGYAWATQGRRLALVMKPVATGQPIRIVDTLRLRTKRTIQVGDRDVCGLTFTGSTLVALTANQPCYWPGGSFELLRIDPAAGRIVRVTKIPAIHTAFPTNLAFGDGRAFVSHAGGGVDAIDLRTGAVAAHHPRRTLAKGEGIVATHFLGGHLLGMGATVVDVRTWHSRTLEPGARGVVGTSHALVAYGPRGIGIYSRSGRLLRRALAGEPVSVAGAVGGLLYAGVGDATDVVNLSTGTQTRVVPNPAGAWALLAP